MTPLPRFLVWLSRIHKCQGFGIQSPTDFDFVRSVVNEHDAYYAYDELKADNWMQRKMGELYLRVANWRQPATILTDDYQQTHQTEQQTEHSEGEEDAEVGVCHLEEM